MARVCSREHPISGKPGIARREAVGFTLLEMMVVVSIVLIVLAMVILNAQTTVRGLRLRESSANYANILQQARVRAVHDDKYYPILTGILSPSGLPIAFVDIAGTGVYTPPDPMMVFSSGVTPMPFSSGPALNNLEAQFLPPSPPAPPTVNSTNPPTFGPRGLPCTPQPSASGTLICPFLQPTSYITFIKNVHSTKWMAVTVTPAGRIQRWAYEGGTWAIMN